MFLGGKEKSFVLQQPHNTTTYRLRPSMLCQVSGLNPNADKDTDTAGMEVFSVPRSAVAVVLS
eukprot:scaffold201305_cov70-Cyclotella_meneghiniana.AAC.10